MYSFIKDPDAVLDFQQDWSGWLVDGDTIVTSTWVADDGITVDSEDHDDATATVWLSGGTVSASYRLVNRITTAQLRTDDRSLMVTVRER